MNNIIEGIFRFVDSGSKDFINKETATGAHLFIVHRVLFYSIMALGFLIFADYYFFGLETLKIDTTAALARSVEGPSEAMILSPIITYYSLAIFWITILSFLSVLCFFLFNRQIVTRIDVTETYLKSDLLSTIIDILRHGVMFCIMVFATGLAAIKCPGVIGLDDLPGFFILQIIVISQGMAISGDILSKIFFLFPPYWLRTKIITYFNIFRVTHE